MSRGLGPGQHGLDLGAGIPAGNVGVLADAGARESPNGGGNATVAGVNARSTCGSSCCGAIRPMHGTRHMALGARSGAHVGGGAHRRHRKQERPKPEPVARGHTEGYNAAREGRATRLTCR